MVTPPEPELRRALCLSPVPAGMSRASAQAALPVRLGQPPKARIRRRLLLLFGSVFLERFCTRCFLLFVHLAVDVHDSNVSVRSFPRPWVIS